MSVSIEEYRTAKVKDAIFLKYKDYRVDVQQRRDGKCLFKIKPHPDHQLLSSFYRGEEKIENAKRLLDVGEEIYMLMKLAKRSRPHNK